MSPSSTGSRVGFWICTYSGALLVIGAFWYILGYPTQLSEPDVADAHKLQCVSYAPFEDDQSPFDFDNGLQISEARVKADLTLLSKRFGCVRTYSTIGLEAVPLYAKELGLQVLLGAWVNADPVATRRELAMVVDLARRYPDTVRAIVVGNETLLRKEVTGSQLAHYIRDVKTNMPEIPVTYADVWEFWLKHPEVAPATDFITIHILPYWEDKPAGIENAMAHLKETYAEVAARIPGKPILIGETGWPSEGRMRGDALPSTENQARFLRGFAQLAEHEGWNYNLIEAFDQPWKRMNEGAVGGYWGIYDTRRIDKGALSGAITNYPDWQRLLLLSMVIAAATLALVSRGKLATDANPLAITGFVVAGAILLPLQGEQFAITARNSWEYLWATVVMTLSATTYLVCAYSIAARQPLLPAATRASLGFLMGRRRFQATHGHGLLRMTILFCAMVEVTGLVFDSRYRSFNNFAFAIPACGFWLTSKTTVTMDSDRAAEKFSALFLIAGAIFILINETPKNIQATLWSVICLALAYPVWKEARQVSLPALKTILIAGILAYAGSASMRYGVMESVDLVSACTDKTNGSLCTVRDTLGRIIHYNGFGWLSLIGAVLTLLSRSFSAAIVTLLLSIAGLTLYNASLSTYAFVASLLLMAMQKPSQKSEAACRQIGDLDSKNPP